MPFIQSKGNTLDDQVAAGKVNARGEAITAAPMPQTAPGVQQTTTQTRNKATSNATVLDSHISTIATTNAQNAQKGDSAVSITRDVDNGDGTHSITYSDGTSGRVTQTKNADGTVSSKDVGDDSANGGPSEVSPLTGQVDAINAYAKKQVNFVNTTLDSLQASSDAATQSMIMAIKQIYAGRVADMEDSNSRLLAGKTQEGLRTGAARYTSTVQNGVLTDEEQQGIMRLATLQGEMLKEVATAQKAQNDEDLTLFNDKMEKIRTIKNDASDQVSKLHDQALAQRKQDLEEQQSALTMAKTQEDLYESKAKAAASAISETLKGFTSAGDKAAFLKEYSDQTGIPITTLMGAVEKAAGDKAKSDLDLENTRSEINSRYLSSQKTQQALDDDSGGTDVKNIVNGVSALSEVDKSKKQAVKSKLQELGFFEEEPPSWFVQAKNEEKGADQTPAVLKDLWETYRQKAIADDTE